MPCVRTQHAMVAASVKQERQQSADAINDNTRLRSPACTSDQAAETPRTAPGGSRAPPCRSAQSSRRTPHRNARRTQTAALPIRRSHPCLGAHQQRVRQAPAEAACSQSERHGLLTHRDRSTRRSRAALRFERSRASTSLGLSGHGACHRRRGCSCGRTAPRLCT